MALKLIWRTLHPTWWYLTFSVKIVNKFFECICSIGRVLFRNNDHLPPHKKSSSIKKASNVSDVQNAHLTLAFWRTSVLWIFQLLPLGHNIRHIIYETKRRIVGDTFDDGVLWDGQLHVKLWAYDRLHQRSPHLHHILSSAIICAQFNVNAFYNALATHHCIQYRFVCIQKLSVLFKRSGSFQKFCWKPIYIWSLLLLYKPTSPPRAKTRRPDNFFPKHGVWFLTCIAGSRG